MRSLHLTGPHRLAWREVPDARLDGDREAVVEPVAASICDIDRPIISGDSPFTPDGFTPFAIGHEGVARVREVGDAVRTVSPGDLVAVAWHIACGTCPRCRAGLSAHCTSAPAQAMYGLPVGGAWGGLFDDLVRVPFADAMLTTLPAGSDPVALVSAGDNLALGHEVMARHVPAGRTRIMVMGWQAVGLLQAAFAVALGASEVVYVDDDPSHRAIAEAYGATAVAGPPSREHGPVDLVVDASFRPAWLRRAVHVLEPEGVVECLGGHFGDLSIPAFAMYATGVTLRIARANTGPHVGPTIEAVASGAVDPTLLHGPSLSWDEAPLALADPALKPVFAR